MSSVPVGLGREVELSYWKGCESAFAKLKGFIVKERNSYTVLFISVPYLLMDLNHDMKDVKVVVILVKIHIMGL